MRVGVLGSGLMGSKLGTIFARAGHEVVFRYARREEKLRQLARAAGGNARAGTPRQAAQDADALLLAVHWSRVDDVMRQAGDLSGKVIVSCCLPLNPSNTETRRRTHLLGRGGTREAGSERPGRLRLSHRAERSAVRRLRSEEIETQPRVQRRCPFQQSNRRRAHSRRGFRSVDAGPLRMARYSEPLALLVGQLAYDGSEGPELAYRFERF